MDEVGEETMKQEEEKNGKRVGGGLHCEVKKMMLKIKNAVIMNKKNLISQI